MTMIAGWKPSMDSDCIRRFQLLDGSHVTYTMAPLYTERFVISHLDRERLMAEQTLVEICLAAVAIPEGVYLDHISPFVFPCLPPAK